MARGRFIDNKIVLSKQVSLLSDDTCRLMFTWMITFADREGRLFGDPALIRGTIFPRNERISIKKVEAYLQELSDVGLILWYEARGDKYILFPGFSDSQIGLRKDKEPESGYPPPTQKDTSEFVRKHSAILPDNFRTTSGIVTPEYKEEVKLMELEVELEAEPALEAPEKETATSPFIDAYRNLTGIEPKKTEEEKAMIQRFTNLGVLPTEYQKAIQEMQEKGYKIASMLSAETWTMNNRNGKKAQKADDPAARLEKFRAEARRIQQSQEA